MSHAPGKRPAQFVTKEMARLLMRSEGFAGSRPPMRHRLLRCLGMILQSLYFSSESSTTCKNFLGKRDGLLSGMSEVVAAMLRQAKRPKAASARKPRATGRKRTKELIKKNSRGLNLLGQAVKNNVCAASALLETGQCETPALPLAACARRGHLPTTTGTCNLCSGACVNYRMSLLKSRCKCLKKGFLCKVSPIRLPRSSVQLQIRSLQVVESEEGRVQHEVWLRRT